MYNTHATQSFLHSYDVIFKNVFKKNISIVKTYITAATITLDVDIYTNKEEQYTKCNFSGITQYFGNYAKLQVFRKTC